MELQKAIELLKKLPEDSGLIHEENWDDSVDTQIWREEAIQALELAVKALEKGSVVGTLTLEGKQYNIVQPKEEDGIEND